MILQIQLPPLISFLFDKIPTKHSKWRFEADDITRHPGKKRIASYTFANMGLQRYLKEYVTMKHTQILKNREIYRCIGVWPSNSVFNQQFPFGQTMTPFRVAGHQVAGAKWHTNTFKCFRNMLSKTLNISHVIIGQVITAPTRQLPAGVHGLLCRHRRFNYYYQFSSRSSGHGIGEDPFGGMSSVSVDWRWWGVFVESPLISLKTGYFNNMVNHKQQPYFPI